MSDSEDGEIGRVRESENEYDSDEENIEEVLVPQHPSISDVDIGANYDRLGTTVPPPPPPLSLEELRMQYPHAFSPASELALQSVLDELQLPFTVSPFQLFATNALLNGVDVVGILPTGSGKTLVQG